LWKKNGVRPVSGPTELPCKELRHLNSRLGAPLPPALNGAQ
jgi:hypothetical protein